MPEIKVTNHLYREEHSFNTHAREGYWTGPKLILWLMYDGFPLHLVLRHDGKENWEAADMFHANYDLGCPLCNKNEVIRCEKAVFHMDQLADAALNHPSFRLIALFELEKKG